MALYGQIIGASMPKGFAGDISRGEFDFTTEARVNNAAAPVSAFGVAVKLNVADGTVSPVSAGSDAVFGFAVRVFGQADMSGVQNPIKMVTVMRRGYFLANVAGTPAAGGQVYLTSAGALTAASSGGTAVPNAVFVAPAVDGITEIAYNI